MAITYEIDVERRTILVRATGELTEHELLDCHHRLARDPAVRPEFSILFDLRGARGESIATEGIRALAGLPLVLSQTSRRAVVVGTDLGYGMARMYGLRRGDRMRAFEVFRDLEEAKRWVELPSAAPPGRP